MPCFCTNCEEPNPYLPPSGITQEFSCEINGISFKGHVYENSLRYWRQYDYDFESKRIDIRAINVTRDTMVTVTFGRTVPWDNSHTCMEVDSIYKQERQNVNIASTLTVGTQTVGIPAAGWVHVTDCDETSKLISGTFDIKVTGSRNRDTLRFSNGRFKDIFYHLMEY